MVRRLTRFPLTLLVFIGIVAAMALLRQRDVPTPSAAQTRTPHLYDREYPVMNYTGAALTDPVARLQTRLDRGDLELGFDTSYGHGYLSSLLAALEVPVESQVLVFSRTSAQIPFISSATPRALYYTDDVYVGWPPGAPEIEIATMDPNLGPVFYTLAQREQSEVRFERRINDCLMCHDTYSLTGGGVPRYILGSGFTDANGEQVTHEGWILVDDRTPLSLRWGGWYVTGTHGQETHMGNWVIRDPEELRDMDLTRTGNLTDLDALIDTDPYPAEHSDIVALMVMDHQTHVQNVITRVNYETRTRLDESGASLRAVDLDPDLLREVGQLAEPLVEALLMVGQPELMSRITGTSGFREVFEAKGPFDDAGRSLRQLDLEVRLFTYPCSYLIYSDAFNALPDVTREYVYRRLREILTGIDRSETFAHLGTAERTAVLQILERTVPDMAR